MRIRIHLFYIFDVTLITCN